jgi:hypothetical protein
MRTALRIALEGSTILALAFCTTALHCMLHFLRSRRAVVASRDQGGSIVEAETEIRRPSFL